MLFELFNNSIQRWYRRCTGSNIIAPVLSCQCPKGSKYHKILFFFFCCWNCGFLSFFKKQMCILWTCDAFRQCFKIFFSSSTYFSAYIILFPFAIFYLHICYRVWLLLEVGIMDKQALPKYWLLSFGNSFRSLYLKKKKTQRVCVEAESTKEQSLLSSNSFSWIPTEKISFWSRSSVVWMHVYEISSFEPVVSDTEIPVSAELLNPHVRDVF